MYRSCSAGFWISFRKNCYITVDLKYPWVKVFQESRHPLVPEPSSRDKTVILLSLENSFLESQPKIRTEKNKITNKILKNMGKGLEKIILQRRYVKDQKT